MLVTSFWQRKLWRLKQPRFSYACDHVLRHQITVHSLALYDVRKVVTQLPNHAVLLRHLIFRKETNAFFDGECFRVELLSPFRNSTMTHGNKERCFFISLIRYQLENVVFRIFHNRHTSSVFSKRSLKEHGREGFKSRNGCLSARPGRSRHFERCKDSGYHITD